MFWFVRFPTFHDRFRSRKKDKRYHSQLTYTLSKICHASLHGWKAIIMSSAIDSTLIKMMRSIMCACQLCIHHKCGNIQFSSNLSGGGKLMSKSTNHYEYYWAEHICWNFSIATIKQWILWQCVKMMAIDIWLIWFDFRNCWISWDILSHFNNRNEIFSVCVSRSEVTAFINI